MANPKDTVVFDPQIEALVQQRVRAVGTDGKLVWDKRGQVRLVNLTEKLLVPVLAKLSNFIPEAGIWLNTQRPEWNDANNALVGNGASMVTLYYLRRHLTFCRELFHGQAEIAGFVFPLRLLDCSARRIGFLNDTDRCWQEHLPTGQRHRVLDDLGRAGSNYRQRLYQHGWSDRKSPDHGPNIDPNSSTLALEWINHSIRSNRRSDGLFHAYNLVRFESQTRLSIRRLYEMLEGQVAVLSSGHLSAEESLKVLTRAQTKFDVPSRSAQLSALSQPAAPGLCRQKQHSRRGKFSRSALLRKLLADGNRQLIERDVVGQVHFNGAITNARDLLRILEQLAAGGYARLVRQDQRQPYWTCSRGFLTTSPSRGVPAPSSATKDWAAFTGTWFPNSGWPPRKLISARSQRARRLGS